jgi:hypothetical protein
MVEFVGCGGRDFVIGESGDLDWELWVEVGGMIIWWSVFLGRGEGLNGEA